jgi:lipoprotein-releasing system ATP-binding protein
VQNAILYFQLSRSGTLFSAGRMIEVDMEYLSPAPQQSIRPEMTGLSPEAGFSHQTLIQVRNLRKEYQTGRGRLVLFDGLSFSVAEGEMLAIVGESGAGKSTLLHILGTLDSPSEGDVYFASIQLRTLNGRQAASFRNREVGYVWQFHYLLPEFTAVENVAMPLLARGEPKAQAFRSAEKWLSEVELGDRAAHRAGELSGGEQQRVSLARALVTGPKVLLADEPTGDLDSRTADVVFDLIKRLHQTHRLTSIIVTHNMALAKRCTRTLRLDKGRMEEVSPQRM